MTIEWHPKRGFRSGPYRANGATYWFRRKEDGRWLYTHDAASWQHNPTWTPLDEPVLEDMLERVVRAEQDKHWMDRFAEAVQSELPEAEVSIGVTYAGARFNGQWAEVRCVEARRDPEGQAAALVGHFRRWAEATG